MKSRKKKNLKLRYVSIDKTQRWQVCQNIAKLFYWSNREDVELTKILLKMESAPEVLGAVEILKNITTKI